jgi:hypothetical protein
MAKKRIFVNKDGDICGLYDAKFGNIPDFGHRTIHRASNIEYNNSTGEWEIKLSPGEQIDEKYWPIAGTTPTREMALEVEKELVEEIMARRLQQCTHS